MYPQEPMIQSIMGAMTVLAANPEFLDQFNTFIKGQRPQQKQIQPPQHVELIDDDPTDNPVDISKVVKPSDAFQHFFSEKIKNLRSQQPNLNEKTHEKTAKDLWKMLTPQQKAPYEEMANKDKLGFAERVLDMMDGKKPIKQRKYAPDQIGPASPYCIFMKDRFSDLKKENKSLDRKDCMKMIGAMWRELSLEEKEKYREQSNEVNIKRGFKVKPPKS